ncbi:hypothetical protein Tco_1324102, partial [Tanacetum coccineum]
MRACVIDFGGSYHWSIRCAPFKALYGRKCRLLVLWAKIRESGLTGLELVQEMTDKVVLVKEYPKATRDCQKSYVDYRCKPLEFEVGYRVLLKVTPWKGVVCFRKKGKIAPRYVGPFKILERICLVAYRLRLPEELNSMHDTFRVSNLKKCLADANLHVLLDEIKVDKTLCFVEEPVEIMDREIKKLKRRKIALVKVRWNLKRGPEFIWEHEDQMRIKYPQLFMDRVVEPARGLVAGIHGLSLWPRQEGYLRVSMAWAKGKPHGLRTIEKSAGGKLHDLNAEESWALLEDLALYENESWIDPRDFAKPVKAIALPQDVSSTSDRRLIKLKNQVQRLMEAHL